MDESGSSQARSSQNQAGDHSAERSNKSKSKSAVIKLAIAFALVAALSLFIDIPVAQWFRNQSFPGDLRTIVRLAEAFSHGYGALLILIGAAWITRSSWRGFGRMTLITYVPGLFTTLGKLAIDRRRPGAYADSLPGSVTSTFESAFGWWTTEDWSGFDRAIQSFPSGHTATAVGLALALSELAPRGRWYFAFIALLCAIQRLDSGAHYPSDTLAATSIALFCYALLFRKRKPKPHDASLD